MRFHEIPVGKKFSYDRERFIKTSTGDCFDPPKPGGGIAWSVLPTGERLKEWAFQGDEVVSLIGES